MTAVRWLPPIAGLIATLLQISVVSAADRQPKDKALLSLAKPPRPACLTPPVAVDNDSATETARNDILTTKAFQRVALPAPACIIAEPPNRQIRITGIKNAEEYKRRLEPVSGAPLGSICPRAIIPEAGGEIILLCDTSSFQARLRRAPASRSLSASSKQSTVFIDIRQPRGAPWLDTDRPPLLPVVAARNCPAAASLRPGQAGRARKAPRDKELTPTPPTEEGPCSDVGRTSLPAAFAKNMTLSQQAECFLFAGNVERAECLFDRALESAAGQQGPPPAEEMAFARLRLGDIAQIKGDSINAAARWQSVGETGQWGRLARARLCELTAQCIDKPVEATIFDPNGLPEPARTEMEIRHWRSLAYRGKTDVLGAKMRTRIAQKSRDVAPCADSNPPEGAPISPVMVCRRLIQEGMRDPLSPGADDALEVYMGLPGREFGPYAVELALLASRVCEANNAPATGANLMAATTPLVLPHRLPDHLARMLDLYVKGADAARASVIADYARWKLKEYRNVLATKAWQDRLSAARELTDQKEEGGVIRKPEARRGDPQAILGTRRANFDGLIDRAWKEVRKAQAARKEQDGN